MSRTSHVRLMASYNEWMNTRLYGLALMQGVDMGATDLLLLVPGEVRA